MCVEGGLFHTQVESFTELFLRLDELVVLHRHLAAQGLTGVGR